MLNKTLLIAICANLLVGQTVEQIQRAKEVIQSSGLSESQVRDVAKSRGYTDQQIDAAIKKGKDKIVEFHLTADDLKFFNGNEYIVEPGEFEIAISGTSNFNFSNTFELKM